MSAPSRIDRIIDEVIGQIQARRLAQMGARRYTAIVTAQMLCEQSVRLSDNAFAVCLQIHNRRRAA